MSPEPRIKYDFKLFSEVGWVIVTAIIVTALTAIAETDVETITNWKVWGAGLGISAARSAAGAALAALGRGALSR